MTRLRRVGRTVAGRGWLLAVAVYLLTTSIFTGPAFIQNRTMGGTEILRHASPYREDLAHARAASNPIQTDQLEQIPFVAEFWSSLRQGRVQLWEPDVGTGVPLLTAVHTRVLAPFHIGFLFVPVHLGTTVAIALGLFVAQISTYGLARRLGATPAAALLAGVVYGFSGPVTALLLRIYEAMLLPALLLAIHASMTERDRRRRVGWLSLSAAVSAGMWTSGFPAAALFCFYFAGAFLLYLGVRTFLSDRPGGAVPGRIRRALSKVSLASVPLVAGTALAAPQLLPTYQFLARSGALDRVYGPQHRAGLDRLATVVSGRFFGAYQDHDWWFPQAGYSNPVEASLTVGLVALALVCLVVAGVRGRGAPELDGHLRRFFVPAGLFVVFAVYLGGLALRLVHLLPFMAENSFARARFIAALVIALTAAFVIDHVRGDADGGVRPTGSLRLQLGLLFALVAVGTYRATGIAAEQGVLSDVRRDLVVPLAAMVGALVVVRHLQARPRAPRSSRLAGCVLVALFAAAELQWGAWGFVANSPESSFYREDDAFEAIAGDTARGGRFRFAGLDRSVLPPNAAAFLDMNDLRISYPAWGRYRELLRVADPDVFQRSRLRTFFTDRLDPASPVLDRMSVRFLILPLKSPVLDGGEAVSVAARLGDELPLAADVEAPVDRIRAIRLRLRPAESTCRQGWVEAAIGPTVSRRLLREVDGEATFPFPDLAGGDAVHLELASTHCPVEVVEDQVQFIPPGPASELRVVSIDDWVVYERPHPRPRAELARGVLRIDDERARLRFLRDRGDADAVVVSGGSAHASYTGGSVRFEEDGADVVRLTVESDGPGLLVLRDVLAPGWRVTVNGERAPILSVDHAFRGVDVPAGSSEVEFSYRPVRLRQGVILAVGGVSLLLVLAVAIWRHPDRDRRRRGN